MTSGSGGPEVPGYRDLRLLGRGGFATVYRARQVAFDREVALKILDGAHADDRLRQLFTRECRAAGSLSWHPHVVPVYDAGTTANGTPYLAMELLPGGSLADALSARGPMDVDAAVRAAGEVASALAAAHETDLLHRDVKPANVLLDRLGRAQLADFGIARVVGTGSATATGAVTGTVAYMAPEVLQGGRATPASDIYALGLTLLTFLVGRNPLTLDSDDSPFVVIARVVSGAPLEVPATVPPPLRALIEACTARDPAGRPSAQQIAATLAGLAPGATPAPMPPPPPVETPAPPALDKAVPPPPPPTSAVRVRADHTLAEPPAPAARPDLAPTEARADPTQVGPGPGPLPPAGSRSRRWPLAVAALVVVALLVVGAVVLLGGGDDATPAEETAGATGADDETTLPAIDPNEGLLDEGDLPGLIRDARSTGILNGPGGDGCGSSDVPTAGVAFSEDGLGVLPNLAHRVRTFPSDTDAAAYLDEHQACSDPPLVPVDGVGDEAIRVESDTRILLEIRVGRFVTQLISAIYEPGDPHLLTDEVIASAVAKVEGL